MTTIELRTSLLQEIAYILDSDEMTKNVLNYIRRLKKAHTEEDSDEEIMRNMRDAFKELKNIKAGKATARPIEEVLNEL